jgi:hypothetical protein
MSAANLKPEHATAAIVAIESASPDEPRLLLLESSDKSSDELRTEAFEHLGRGDVITLGMIFRQFDEQSGQQATFPYQFVGLNERGLAVLRDAATRQVDFGELTKHVN